VDWLEAEARKAARPDSPVPSFWRQWLHGLTATPPLPYDRGPAPVLTDPLLPERHSLRLSQAETSLLNAAAQSWGVTLNTLVQAAWALTAARLTGQTSVVFGAARACRKTVPDAEWMLGPLVNTLPLRVDLDPSRSLSDLLHDLRQRWLDLRPMEWASHNDIRHWAGLPASVQLYETVLNFNGASFTAQAQSFVSGSDHRFFQYRQSLDMPLALHAFADPEMLFWLEHDPRRISSSDGHSLLESWVSTLQSLASHPASSLRTWLS
jgi:non-ribosomal peptide synthetase component F